MYRILIATIILSTSLSALADTASPYRGQQLREIKSLSPSEIDGYLTGKGMGFAKAAELNHYPGPRHVLDLAEQLKLDNHQLQQTQNLFNKMQTSAIELGRQLVDQEKELDRLFDENKATRESLEKTLKEIGSTVAELRFVHLSAHLEQKRILNKHQVMMYDQLRGYNEADHGSNHGSHSQNHSH